MSPLAVQPRLAALSRLVPHLRWRIGRPEVDEFQAGALAGDPRRLAELVASTAAGRGSEDPQVLGSLWWQAYAYRVGGTTLACWTLSGAAPDPALDAGTAVGIGRSRPCSVVYGPQARALEDLEELIFRLFAGNFDPVAASLRSRHALGEQLVWGNALAAIASALSAVGSAEGAPPLRDRADELIDALPHGMAGLGQWVDGSQHRWAFRRRTCCLWWKTAPGAGSFCEDCSLR
ncbi:MAG: hypothetical protein ACYDAD_00845 [Acidimicrobiales bacterium]